MLGVANFKVIIIKNYCFYLKSIEQNVNSQVGHVFIFLLFIAIAFVIATTSIVALQTIIMIVIASIGQISFVPKIRNLYYKFLRSVKMIVRRMGSRDLISVI